MSATATVVESRAPHAAHAADNTSDQQQPQEQPSTVKQLNPYVCLNGTVEQAIRLYESALGAKVESLQRYGETPGCGPVAPEHQQWIVHAALRIGPGVLMLTDATPDRAVPAESNVSIALDFAEPAELERAFAALGAGGTVVCPIMDSFWGAKFGVLTDAYGVSWMFNCQIKQA